MNLKRTVYSPVTHVFVYVALLLYVPFIATQFFLQRFVGEISDFTVTIAGIRFPLVFSVVAVVAVIFLIAVWKKITRYRLTAGIACLIMLAVSQKITDFYLGKPFYDIQYNWHYLAYCGYTLILYRALRYKRVPANWTVLICFFSAAAISVIDEINQCTWLKGIWDISDISKDCMGVLTGLVIMFFVVEQGARAGAAGWRLRHRKLKEYIGSPWTVLVLAILLDYLLMIFASHLTDDRYWWIILSLTIGAFLLVVAGLHLSQFKPVRYTLAALLAAALVIQGVSCLKQQHPAVIHKSPGLIVYNGLPVPFFDLIIFPDDTFRLVDKKHYFYTTDIWTMLRQKPDILLIGTGSDGRGGIGFGTDTCQFMYNRATGRCTQIILQKTPDACETFNRLKREGTGNVVFVIHNT